MCSGSGLCIVVVSDILKENEYLSLHNNNCYCCEMMKKRNGMLLCIVSSALF